MNVFGIDVGGSGIKGAPVDTETGELRAERTRIKTPKPATPEAIVVTAVEVVRRSGWDGPVGCGFPAVVKEGVVRAVEGVVLMLTLGTGIGTSLFVEGRLVPNTELGHIEIRGKDAEHHASDRARKRDDLSWREYAERLDEYLHKIEDLLWPDLIVVGGGISKKSEKFFPHLTARTKIVPAEMLNEAGIAGAALAGIPTQATVEAAE